MIARTFTDPEVGSRKLVISRHNPWRKKWDYFIMILAIYNCLWLPIEISFEPPVSINDQA